MREGAVLSTETLREGLRSTERDGVRGVEEPGSASKGRVIGTRGRERPCGDTGMETAPCVAAGAGHQGRLQTTEVGGLPASPAPLVPPRRNKVPQQTLPLLPGLRWLMRSDGMAQAGGMATAGIARVLGRNGLESGVGVGKIEAQVIWAHVPGSRRHWPYKGTPKPQFL